MDTGTPTQHPATSSPDAADRLSPKRPGYRTIQTIPFAVIQHDIARLFWRRKNRQASVA
jgi:hypothetical protein